MLQFVFELHVLHETKKALILFSPLSVVKITETPASVMPPQSKLHPPPMTVHLDVSETVSRHNKYQHSHKGNINWHHEICVGAYLDIFKMIRLRLFPSQIFCI